VRPLKWFRDASARLCAVGTALNSWSQDLRSPEDRLSTLRTSGDRRRARFDRPLRYVDADRAQRLADCFNPDQACRFVVAASAGT